MDYHLHSRFSRACSKQLTFPNIALTCNQKGIDIVGTADFTHPQWFKEMGQQLEETEKGLYQVKKALLPVGYRTEGGFRPVRFVISSELSCIYKQGEKTRRVHLVFLIPSLEVVAKINAEFDRRGWNRKSDGRPILGISAKDLFALMLEIDPEIILIPAHIWTPYFAVFGSKSGFDSLAECFGGQLAKKIPAVETGLSSDPTMNWRIKELDNYRLVSASDAHSLSTLGREATVINLKNISFDGLADALWGGAARGTPRDVNAEFFRSQSTSYATRKLVASEGLSSSPFLLQQDIENLAKENKNNSEIISTLEFFPEEGRYHADGCADCKFSCAPEESKKLNGRCPKCNKILTLGVLYRVDELSGHAFGERPKTAKSFEYLLPLPEIIGSVLNVGKTSKKVATLYNELIKNMPEIDILRAKNKPPFVTDEIWQTIMAVRAGEVEKIAGYDGEYGRIIPRVKKIKQNTII